MFKVSCLNRSLCFVFSSSCGRDFKLHNDTKSCYFSTNIFKIIIQMFISFVITLKDENLWSSFYGLWLKAKSLETAASRALSTKFLCCWVIQTEIKWNYRIPEDPRVGIHAALSLTTVVIGLNVVPWGVMRTWFF